MISIGQFQDLTNLNVTKLQ